MGEEDMQLFTQLVNQKACTFFALIYMITYPENLLIEQNVILIVVLRVLCL
jgi:hypothetical protein